MIIDQNRVDHLTANQPMGFADALYLIECGKRMCRGAWKDVNYVALQKPDENSKMKKAYLYRVGADNQPVPWTPSHDDLFMYDWVIVQ